MISRVIIPCVALLLIGSAARAANFTGDARLVAAAEECRTAAFKFYGYAPQDWSAPCPIQLTPGGGGGQTSFRFEQGEVFGWNMQLQATPEQAIESVIPHEVDHTVRASIVRRPIPRWVDEGMSSQWESAAEQRRLAEFVQQYSPTESDLDSLDYPGDGREVLGLYAWGHRAVQHLLVRGTPQTLIAFMHDERRVADKLPEYYGMTSTEFLTTCRRPPAVCGPEGCQLVPYPAQLPRIDNRPLLEVWTRDNCDPCAAFWSDLDGPELAVLKQRFHIHRRMWRGVTLETTLKGVTLAPTFLVSGRVKIVGYTSPEDLLQRLGLEQSAPKITEPAPKITEPAPFIRETPPMITEPAASIHEPPVSIQAPELSTGTPTPPPAKDDRLDRLLAGMQTAVTVATWIGVGGATGGTGALILGGASLFFRLRKRRLAAQSKRTTTTGPPRPSAPPTPQPAAAAMSPATVLLEEEAAEAEPLPETQVVRVIDDRWRKGVIYSYRQVLEKHGTDCSHYLREFTSHIQQYVGCRIDINDPQVKG